ncbi:MAG: magnesium and cobalt transport protein CorA, partial [Gammaproteobacteria bacterium]
MLERLGQTYGLHPLALEDVLNQGQRTKFEAYENQYFVVLNSPRRESDTDLVVEQVNFFLGKGYVITLDESPNDRFEPIRQRLRNKRMMRGRGADHLFYSLLDLIVDEGFPLLDALGERLEQVETDVLDNPTQELRNQIHYIKRELILLRRAWWPQREVINSLIRNDDEDFLSETTRLYMRDCHDHSLRLIDFVETYREMASSLLDTYLSSVSQRMND